MNKPLTIPKLLFYLYFFLLTSCATNNTIILDEDSDFANPPFRIIAQGQYSNISLSRQLVIKNRQDWQRLWNIHRLQPDLKRPYINFSNDMVIAVFAGQQPSGGYAVGINHLKRMDNNLYVSVTFKEPGRNETVSLALTQPYIFIATEKIDGKVIFIADTLSNRK